MSNRFKNLVGNRDLQKTDDAALRAPDMTPLHWVSIVPENVRAGQILRFQHVNPEETVVGVVRVEPFSPVDEQFVVDAIYRDATLSNVWDDYINVSILIPIN